MLVWIMMIFFSGLCAGFGALFDEATLPTDGPDYPSGLVWIYRPPGLAEGLRNPQKSAILVIG
jgi:hypothetical protein